MTIQYNNERTFGIELELTRVDFAPGVSPRQDLAQRINMLDGVKCFSPNRISENRSGYWKVVSDCSVSGMSLEVVSPILKGTEGLQQLKKVCDLLNALNAEVDRSCGVHVHHGMQDFKHNVEGARKLKALYSLYWNHEDVIFSMLPRSRRANNFNRRLRWSQAEAINNASFTFELGYSYYTHRIIEGHGVKDSALRERIKNYIKDRHHYDDSRYTGLNLHSYWDKGTVEFRSHGGTTDYDKLVGWITFTQAMVELAATKKVHGRKVKNSRVSLKKQTARLMDLIDHNYVRAYVEQRQAKFARLNETMVVLGSAA